MTRRSLLLGAVAAPIVRTLLGPGPAFVAGGSVIGGHETPMPEAGEATLPTRYVAGVDHGREPSLAAWVVIDPRGRIVAEGIWP